MFYRPWFSKQQIWFCCLQAKNLPATRARNVYKYVLSVPLISVSCTARSELHRDVPSFLSALHLQPWRAILQTTFISAVQQSTSWWPPSTAPCVAERKQCLPPNYTNKNCKNCVWYFYRFVYQTNNKWTSEIWGSVKMIKQSILRLYIYRGDNAFLFIVEDRFANTDGWVSFSVEKVFHKQMLLQWGNSNVSIRLSHSYPFVSHKPTAADRHFRWTFTSLLICGFRWGTVAIVPSGLNFSF